MKHQRLYGRKVDLSDWELAAVNDGVKKLKVDLKRIVINAATEALEIAIKAGGEAYFPIEWSAGESDYPNDGYEGPAVDDPNIIYFGFPLCGDEVEYRCFKADLREMIGRMIESYSGPNGPIVGKYRSVLEKVATALKDCAAKIDEALKREGV